jgi:hypothetical protein
VNEVDIKKDEIAPKTWIILRIQNGKNPSLG